VIAPDRWSLETRWRALAAEKDLKKKELLFHPHAGGDRTVEKGSTISLPGHPHRALSVARDARPVVPPTPYAFRSLDRQWIIPDNRLLNRPNPQLWQWHSDWQVYLTAPEDRTPTNGPALTLSSAIPDLHHYHGRGGRVFPLWRDAAATSPNVKPALLGHLAAWLRRTVRPEDFMAYLAAVLAHPAFTSRFAADLQRPGLRVPLSAAPELFDGAVTLGREVAWLHCYGERFADPGAGRPHGPPRMPRGTGPTVPAGGTIPGVPEPLPDVIDYDPARRRLIVGSGFVDNVAPEVWAYEVSGRSVLRQWFSYRRGDRTRPVIGDRRPPSPLDRIQPDHWLPEYTEDLLNLLHVLGRLVALEPQQAALLDAICGGPLFDAVGLEAVGALAGLSAVGGGVRDEAAIGDLFGRPSSLAGGP
jgi:hypothetical protein